MLIFAGYLIAYLLTIAVGACIPIAVGTICYYFSAAQVRDSARDEIFADATNVINVTLTDTTLKYSINEHKLERHIFSYNEALANTKWLSLSAAGVTFILAWLGGVFKGIRVDTVVFPDVLSAILGGAIAIGGTAAITNWHRKPPLETIRQMLHDHIEQLNNNKPVLENFGSLLKENHRLRTLLQVASTTSHEAELRNIVLKQQRSEIVTTRISITDALANLQGSLAGENKKLRAADAAMNNVMAIYQQAAQAASRTRNLALLYYLDQLKRGIDTTRILVADGRFAEFLEHMASAADELDALIANADEIGDSDFESEVEATEGSEPYSVFGVRSDLSDDDLKKVYRILANLYHPDKGMAPDHRRFQQIEGAWRELKLARNM